MSELRRGTGQREIGLGSIDRDQGTRLLIPQDIALIGWDDFDAAPHLQTPLTVVDQPAYSMGSIAAEQLMKMRSNEPADASLPSF